ncbi:MAG: TIGR03809 family protein [Pseudolabrys sp.]
MSAELCARRFIVIAQGWSDLAERRRDYFVELYNSGRWKHYYDERQFVARMRDVVKAAEIWSKLAGRQDPPSALLRKAS